MRKLISILLLIMFLQPPGYVLIFKVQQYQIRKEMKHRIKNGVPEEELALLKIPRKLEEESNHVFQRIHEREFRYEGKMYDIVRQEQYGDTTWYYCVSDEKETVLFANLDDLVNREASQNPQRKQQSEELQRLLNTFFVVQHNRPYPVSSPGEGGLIDYRFDIQTWINTPPVPPPKV